MFWIVIGLVTWFAIMYVLRALDRLGIIDLDESDPYEDNNVILIDDFR